MNELKEHIEIQTATFVKEHIKDIIELCTINNDELNNLLDKEYSKKTFGLSSYSFLTLVNSGNKGRYWVDEYLINSETYLVCSQWGGRYTNRDGISTSQRKGDKFIEYLSNHDLLLDKYKNKNIEFVVGSLEDKFKKWWTNNFSKKSDGNDFAEATKSGYLRALKQLKTSQNIDIFLMRNLDNLNKLLVRLDSGDLSEYNKRNKNRDTSNGLKQYIKFLNDESNEQEDIKFNEIQLTKENTKNDFKFSDEEKGNLDFLYKNILFKGVPGTGKSRAIDTIIEKELNIKDEKKNILRVNIHSASSNADLMQGIGISTNANGSIKYSEKQGLILDMIKRATFHPKQPFVLILEEIQENSLNELIGDLIYLIEEDKRAKEIEADNEEYSYEELVNKLIEEHKDMSYIEVPYLVNDSTDYKKMIMPNNLFIFCTSNYRDDKKVIEDNLLRRFEVIEIYPKNKKEMGKDENEEDYFKSKDVSDFLEALNTSILKVMDDNHETHPDRFIIGHSIWKDVTDDKTFYKAFSKLITEFKDIREVEFDIFKEILKDIDLPKDIEIELKKSYFELIKDLQIKINYGFLN